MLSLLLLLLFAAVPLCAQERVYVVQTLDESLGEIRSGQVNSHLLDLGYGCNEIAVSGSYLYVTNSLLNTVQEINAETNTTVREIPTSGGVNPYGIVALNEDTLAVTCWVSNNLLLIRRSDGAVIGDIPVGVAPQGMVVRDDRLFVCLTRYLAFGNYGPGAVMVYDRHSLGLLDSISVGTNPQYAALDNAGRLHVVCTGDYGAIGGRVDVVSVATLAVDTVLEVGGTPANIAVDGTHAFLAAGGWGDDGLVYRYRLSDLAVLNGLANPLTTGSGATDVEIGGDGSIFVSCFNTDVIEQYSTDWSLLASFPMSDGPGNMVFYSGPAATEPPRAVVDRDLRIAEAYPNPFNNAIELRLSGSPHASSHILIYNTLGQIADRISVAAGTALVRWDPRSMPVSDGSTGVYFAVWEAGGGAAVKLLYLK